MIAQLVVALYRFWHGRCHLKGGGYFLKKCSEFLPGLQNYPLQIEGLGTVPVDFRDSSGFVWLNHLLGEKLDTKVMEKGLFHALDRVLKEEDVFWDVGANIGTISVHVVTRHRHVRIFAFEPNPRLFNSISVLFARQPLVKVFPFALSDRDSDLLLSIPKGSSLGASVEGIDYVLQTSHIQKKDVDQVRVQAFKGDSLMETQSGLLPPNVLKINVEGHESAVLKGIAKTILKNRPVIFFEHLYLSDEAVTSLVPQGYSLRSVDGESGELTPAFDRSVGHNSVLLPVAKD